MKNVIIGLGNAGSQIVRLASKSKKFAGDKLFTIDSVTSNVDMDSIANLTSIPIVSDERTGSGRNRKRGFAMFNYHKSLKHFDDMFAACDESKNPIILVSSAAGGTGSGAIIGLATTLIRDYELDVIPIIISPADEDPSSYHMNTCDLLVELAEIVDVDGNPGIKSYSVFRNPSNPNYTSINKAIVKSIEVILGYYYDDTTLDSIDESDLNKILSFPGRFISVYAEASDIGTLKKELTRSVMSGYQPGWTSQEAEEITFNVAYSLTSMFASDDFNEVFSEITERCGDICDKFKNVTNIDDGDICYATAIIAGLPTIKVKKVDGEFNGAGTIADGIQKTVRPEYAKPAVESSKKKKKKSVLADFGLE